MLSKILIGTITVAILNGCGGGSTTSNSYINAKFVEDSSANILNPDRGFYDADYALNKDKDYNRFKHARDDGFVMVYAPIDLEKYVTTSTLPSSLLDTIEKNLVDAENAGVKLIFRIKYSSKEGDDDATKEVISGHLAQLKPILQKHKDIISVIQAGVIGAWGEWHNFTGDYSDDNPDYINNRKDIITKLSEIFPDKYIQIRTPMHKELLYGTSKKNGDKGTAGMITQDIAYSDDIRAKIGYHNDCFLASSTDMGTYPSDDIKFWQDYVVNDSKYAPVGGETCKDDQTYTTCSNALIQLKKFHYSYLNEAYYSDVLKRWKSEGCYDEIKQNLGYRLVAKELDIKKSDTALTISLSIENKGYASPYINYDVKMILKNSSNKYTFTDTIDTRKLYAGETKTLSKDVEMSTMKSGDYCLYLQIGNSYSSVRLSNSDIWDDSTKTNKLKCGIEVD